MPDAVVFGERASRLMLAFEPESLRGGAKFEFWPRATVELVAQGLRAVGAFSFMGEDLAPFVDRLEAIHRSLSGKASLESEDGDLRLEVRYFDAGRVTVSGHLQPNLYEKTIVTYEIDTDQSYLAETLRVLRSLFPSS
jgi:hypothetical protein